MQVFRLSKKKYAAELSGVGASLSNNRWNSKGTEIIYTAESRALALAEVLVHLEVYALKMSYVMLTIEIPNDIQLLNISDLPDDWNVFPGLSFTQHAGDQFIAQNNYAVAKVPSAVVQGDFNYLLNPKHKDFKKIKITQSQDFLFDNRLF